jgi:hypothetical protein
MGAERRSGEARRKRTREPDETHPYRSAKATVQQATADNLRPRQMREREATQRGPARRPRRRNVLARHDRHRDALPRQRTTLGSRSAPEMKAARERPGPPAPAGQPSPPAASGPGPQGARRTRPTPAQRAGRRTPADMRAALRCPGSGHKPGAADAIYVELYALQMSQSSDHCECNMSVSLTGKGPRLLHVHAPVSCLNPSRELWGCARNSLQEKDKRTRCCSG